MQHHLTLKHISKSYPTKTLFTDASFSVSVKDRVAIIGENGSGKSSLLKMISDQEPIDSGAIIKDHSEVLYVAQEFFGDESLDILSYLDQQNAKSTVFELVKKFDVLTEKQIESLTVGELSGGQKRILCIAAALSRAPKWLCIDEPENHLDIKSRAVLIGLLQNYWGGVIFVSHDRYVINQLATKIALIEHEKIDLVSGMSYEEFIAKQTNQLLNDQQRWKAEAQALEKLQSSVQLLHRRAKVNSNIATTYQMKKRELAKRQAALGAKPKIENTQAHITTSQPSKKISQILIVCTDVVIAFGSKVILQDISLQLHAGEKVLLLGRNGSGKSTFVQLLQQTQLPSKGSVTVGKNVRFGYLQQTQDLDMCDSPLSIMQQLGLSEEQSRSLLAQILFTRYESEGLVKNLSGGQMQRLRFLRLFAMRPDCVVLDEPTNNLDPTTWEVLLQLINNFTGAVLLISHDREFLTSVNHSQIWLIKNQSLKQIWKPLPEVIDSL